MSGEINIENKFGHLQDALRRDSEEDVQNALFDLGGIRNDWSEMPDEVVERLLTLLRSEKMYNSPYAGHLLQFFEFESARLTDRQKWLCIGFLKAHGDKFSDVHSQQVVIELRYGRYGDYLKMKKPNSQQWNDCQEMQNGRSKK